MAGELHFRIGRENTDIVSAVPGLPRRDERRLGEIDFPRDPLHFLIAEGLAVHESRKWVAPVLLGCEHIGDEESRLGQGADARGGGSGVPRLQERVDQRLISL